MMIREPAVAGVFYASGPDQCRAELRRCLDRAAESAAEHAATAECGQVVGGIVPHAGWLYSGAVAARVFQEIALRQKPEVVVLFGAAHRMHGSRAAVFSSGAWETPLGLAKVDTRLAERLLGQTGLLDSDAHAHDQEHSIEVQVPFIQHLMPDASILPIIVPANDQAAALGSAVGKACQTYGVGAVFVGSTDLTHYGPSYDFTPQGIGPAGLAWAKEVNDRRMIDLISAMKAEDAVGEAETNHNACGGGAIAAAITACQAMGAKRAILLEHTTSNEVLSELPDPATSDAVGYAGILFD